MDNHMTPNAPCTITPPHPLAGTPCTFVEERAGTGTSVYMLRIESNPPTMPKEVADFVGVVLPVFPQVVRFQETQPCTADPAPGQP